MSFFKSDDSPASATASAAPVDIHGAAPGIAAGRSYVISTGGQLDDMVAALVRNAHDSDARTRKGMSQALFDIGLRQPNLVASSIFDFLVNDNKHSQAHRVQLLESLEKVVSERRDQLDAELCRNALTLALADMVRSKDVVPDWQGAASTLLVSLGMRFPDDLMKELLKLFAPGAVPHYFVIKTFGDFLPANPLAAVPRLREVLARVLPVLASIKMPNLKWVFATALGNFCEAILHYVANVEDIAAAAAAAGQPAAAPAFTLDSFSSEIFPCYEVLFATWLTDKEAKVRLATIKALGAMCAVIARPNFDEQLPRLLPALLGLYKKEKQQLPITQGMCSVLAVAVKDKASALEPLLPALLAALHPMACQPPDVNDPSDTKNINELHRCFGIIGQVFAEPLVSYLVERLSSKEARARVGTLQVMKHLVTRNDKSLEALKSLLMAGVKPYVVNEKDLRVKKALAQLIISMASHRYLLLSGGEAMIDFIVANSAITDAECQAYNAKKDKGGDDDVSPSQLRELCDNVLNLITTTVDGMHEVLWPYLFEALVKPELSGAMGVVCKCLAFIAHTKRESQAADFIIDFDRAVNLPKPVALLARLLVCVSRAMGRNQLGAHTLHLLRAAGPLLHPAACDMWDQAAPRLLAYLESQGDGDFQQARWEELILRLLEKTLAIADDDQWAIDLCDQYAAQYALYNAPADADLKKVALKHTGVVLQKLQHREFIRTKLDVMFRRTVHQSDTERQGCAQGFGYAATSHLDIVVDYLVNVEAKDAKSSGGGGGGGFLSSLFKPKGPQLAAGEEPSGAIVAAQAGEAGRATIVLCYGFVCAFGPPSQVAARVDVHIIAQMTPALTNAKSESFKRAATQAIDLIGKAMTPAHLKQPYTLKQRDALVGHLVNFMTHGDVTAQIRAQGLAALTTLARLAPPLPMEQEATTLEALLPFFDLTVSEEPKKEDKRSLFGGKSDKAPAASAGASESAIELLELAQANLRQLLLVLLAPQPDAASLIRMFRHLEKWLTSREARHRERALAATLALLAEHLKLLRTRQRAGVDIPTRPEEKVAPKLGAVRTTVVVEAQRGFASLGSCLAMLIPRCTDPSQPVRTAAVAAIETLLYTDHLLTYTDAVADDIAAVANPETPIVKAPRNDDEQDDEQHTGSDDNEGDCVPRAALPERLSALRQHRAALSSSDTNAQYRALAALTKEVLSRPDVLAPSNLLQLLLGCLRALADPTPTSTSGVCVVLNTCITARGQELLPQVKALTDGLLVAMDTITDAQTLNGALHAIRTIASHHLLPVVNQLLDRPLPQTSNCIRALQVLAKDAQLADPMLLHFVDIINNGQLYDEVASGKAVKAADKAPEGSSAAAAQSNIQRQPLPLAMTATASLQAVLAGPDGARLAVQHYATLASALLLRVGTAHGSLPPAKAANFGADVRADTGACDALKAFLEAAGDKGPLRAADYSALTGAQYTNAIASLVAAMCRARLIANAGATQQPPPSQQSMAALFIAISPYIKGNFIPQRVVAACVIAELVQHAPETMLAQDGSNTALLERLLQSLLASLIDPQIKRFALRGLGNVVAAGEHATNRFAPTVLDALTSSIEHADEDIVFEAMAGLSKVFNIVEQGRVQPILVNICHRIRPAFGKENDGIRAEAFRLFGTLARFGEGGQAADTFYEMWHSNLPLLLLHIGDDSDKVKEACREALNRLAPLARDATATAMLSGRHLRPGRSMHYGEFADDACKALIQAFPQRINFLAMTFVENFKSNWVAIKANAAVFVGLLLTNIDVARRREYNLNPMLISRALIQLLSDKAPVVRQRGAEAIALLHTY